MSDREKKEERKNCTPEKWSGHIPARVLLKQTSPNGRSGRRLVVVVWFIFFFGLSLSLSSFLLYA